MPISAARSAPGIPPVFVPERVHASTAVLLWQARGASTCVLDGSRHRLVAGRALWIPACTRHELDVEAESVLLPLHFASRLQPVGALDVPTWICVDAALRTAILALLQKQTSIIRADADVERQVVRMLVERIVPPSALPMPGTDYARAIAERFLAEPLCDTSLVELAAEQHVSPRSVERAFLSETGMSPQQWRGGRRMEIAAGMLVKNDTPGVVAGRVGYSSPSAFRRAFRRQFGMTPGEYATTHRLPL